MRDILVHIGHPAHVHLLRYPVQAWREGGRWVMVALRDKDLTLELARHYGLEGQVLSKPRQGRLGGFLEMLKQDSRLALLALGWRPVLVGTSIAIAHVGWLFQLPSLVLIDDDVDVLGGSTRFWFPFCTAIFAPRGVRTGPFAAKTIFYPSFQKLFYLHPNRFNPDKSIRTALGLADGEGFGVVRLSALQAHHDRGARGMTDDLVREILSAATRAGLRVFISSEKKLPVDLEGLRFPILSHHMHNALALADFFLGDSQSMAVEAALLGTPSFRFNTFAGRISVLNELEDFGLTYGFLPGEEAQLLSKFQEILARPDRKEEFTLRRRNMLERKIDPLPWFLRVVDLIGEGASPEEVRRRTGEWS